jgi:hypothetical protein
MLKPTHRTDIAMDPGTIRLDINHSSVAGLQAEKKRHRIFSDVPAVDIQPPEGITSISLQSVRIDIDILETSPRKRPTAKRTVSPSGEWEVPTLQDGESDTFLHELALDRLAHVEHADHISTAPKCPAYAKRKRSATKTLGSPQSGPSEQTETSKRRRGRLANGSCAQQKSSIHYTCSDRIDIASMVDGALRLSICGTLNKVAIGWKAKASTFRLGLADVAPAIWKPGYLVVRDDASVSYILLTYGQALSQRAHLLPTIALSIGRVGGVRATSISLRDKIKDLKKIAQHTSMDHLHPTQPNANYENTAAEPVIASRLWVQSQRTLLDKAMAPVKACVTSILESSQLDSDDMLAEGEQDRHHVPRTTSFQTDSLHECFEDVSATDYAQATEQQGQSLGSPSLLFDVREGEDNLFLDSHSPNVVSATVRTADIRLHEPSSPTVYALSKPRIPIQQYNISSSQRCLTTSQTAQHPLEHQSDADYETSHRLSHEGDVDCTEDLLLIS